MADVDGNGSPTSIDDLASVGEEERATLGPLDDRGDVSGGDERVGGSPLVVDRRSLADLSARCGFGHRSLETGCHKPAVPLLSG